MIREHARKNAVPRPFTPNKIFRQAMPQCNHAESTLRLTLILAARGYSVRLLYKRGPLASSKCQMDERLIRQLNEELYGSTPLHIACHQLETGQAIDVQLVTQ